MSLMVMKAYSAEFKADAVAQYLSDPSHTFDGIGQDLGVSRETLRNWVRAERKRSGVSGTADRDRKLAPAGEVSSDLMGATDHVTTVAGFGTGSG